MEKPAKLCAGARFTLFRTYPSSQVFSTMSSVMTVRSRRTRLNENCIPEIPWISNKLSLHLQREGIQIGWNRWLYIPFPRLFEIAIRAKLEGSNRIYISCSTQLNWLHCLKISNFEHERPWFELDSSRVNSHLGPLLMIPICKGDCCTQITGTIATHNLNLTTISLIPSTSLYNNLAPARVLILIYNLYSHCQTKFILVFRHVK